MNFRLTTLLFGLLLSTLWIFGLMIAYKKSAGDQSFITPSLQGDVKITRITIEKTVKDKDVEKQVKIKFEVDKTGDSWYHIDESGQKVKVEGHRIKQGIIEAIRNAKHDDTSDTSKAAKSYGMSPPQMTVTLEGELKGEEKKWEFFVGKESVDRAFVYVNSSERRDKVFAVSSKNMEGLLFKDAKYLRAKRVFDFVDTSVTEVKAVKADDKLEIKKDDDGLWKIVVPPLGYAGPFDSEPEEKKKDFLPKEPAIGSVKSLLNNIIRIHVEDDDDFEALGKPAAEYGLAKGQETMRIEVTTGEKKDAVTETLLIGKKVPAALMRERKGDIYYAKLAGDDGVMQISGKLLEPLEKVLKEPGKIRSHDIAVFDADKVDYIVIKQGNEEFKFFKTGKDAPKMPPGHEKFAPPAPEPEWHLFVGKEKQKASREAVQKLIEQVQGKKKIEEFTDFPAADIKKREAEMGLDPAVAEIAVYLNAIEKKKEDDKEEKKEEKKDEKKDDKAKTAAGKDDPPKLNKDIKAAVALAIGKTEKETVHARRSIEEGKAKSWFTLKKDFVEKLLPAEGVQLAFSDLSLPTFPLDEAVVVKLQRLTDRGMEEFEFTRTTFQNKQIWHLKDGAGSKLANSENVGQIAEIVSQALAKKLVKKLDDKDDLDKYGLKKPGVIVTVTTKKREPVPAVAARLIGMLGFVSLVDAVADAVAQMHAEKGEVFTLELGKETTDEKDRGGIFARHSGSKMLFLLPGEVAGHIKRLDLRDRVTILYNQPQLEALYKANTAFNPYGVLMFASPHYTGAIHNFDVDKIKEVRLDVRTPAEFRSFQFVREAKDKEKDKDKPWTWTDKSPSLKEFQLDSEKVNQLVKDFAKLKAAERFAVYVLPKDAKAVQEALDSFKLGPKDYTAKLELVIEDEKQASTTITLTIGMNHQPFGYYGHSSALGESVFFVSPTIVEPLLRGPSQFAKERFAGN